LELVELVNLVGEFEFEFGVVEVGEFSWLNW
jgi:hypothetical protein